MRLRQTRFDSESTQLFGLRKPRERLRTKNVHEAPVLHSGWYAMENRYREITSNKQRARPLARSRPNMSPNVYDFVFAAPAVGLVVRDARRCRAPHHEGLKPHPEEHAPACVSKG